MFKIGDEVRFKKSDNSWEKGIVMKIYQSPYITVQWVHDNKLLGYKKVHRVFVKQYNSLFRILKTKYCLLSGFILFIFISVDSYLYLRKVRKLY